MGLFANLRTGWTLSIDSLAVLRDHPRLVVFPAISGVATGAFFVLLYLGVFVAGLFGGGLELLALFVLYLVTTFVASFFTAALVHAVNDALHGREPAVGPSLRAAAGMWRPLVVWSVVAAFVSLILRWLEDSDSPLSRVAAAVFSLGWTVTTFFIIPVIVFEDVDARSMFTRSGATFRDTWGETLGAGLGLGVIQLLFALAAVVLAVAVFFLVGVVSPGVGIAAAILVGGLGLLAAFLVGQTIRGIAKTALYLYAKEGRVPDDFENFEFETLGGRTQQRAAPDHGRVQGQI